MTHERIDAIVAELHEARNARGAPNTATMTFVLYIDDAQVASGIRERMRALAEKHPSRVILWDATAPSSTAHADTTLTHSEWIDLGGRESSVAELCTAVERLALPEVPLVLMWGGRESVASEPIGALVHFARSIICDSSLARDATSALRDLAALCEDKARLAIADLAYLRLAPWQDCVASFFDDDTVRDDARHIDRVDVTCGAGAEGLYALGWLGSRLGWSPAGSATFATQSGAVYYSITRTDDPRRIRRIEITCGSTRYRAEIDNADPNTIVFEGGPGVHRPHRCRALGVTDMASLVERAILQSETDAIFRESLALAGALA